MNLTKTVAWNSLIAIMACSTAINAQNSGQYLTIGSPNDPPADGGRITVNTNDMGLLVISTNPHWATTQAQTLTGLFVKDELSAGDVNQIAFGFKSIDDIARGGDVRFWAKLEAIVETQNTTTKGAGFRFLTSSDVGGQGTERVRFTHDGKVGIGTSTPQGKLDVNGSIFQRGSSLHADYVFERSYKLEDIEEHAAFMWREKRLSGLPPTILDQDGRQVVELGAQQKGILEELEKAHIYISQLHDRLEAQGEAIKDLTAKLAVLLEAQPSE